MRLPRKWAADALFHAHTCGLTELSFELVLTTRSVLVQLTQYSHLLIVLVPLTFPVLLFSLYSNKNSLGKATILKMLCSQITATTAAADATVVRVTIIVKNMHTA